MNFIFLPTLEQLISQQKCFISLSVKHDFTQGKVVQK